MLPPRLRMRFAMNAAAGAVAAAVPNKPYNNQAKPHHPLPAVAAPERPHAGTCCLLY